MNMEKITLTAKKSENDTRERHGIVPQFIPESGTIVLDVGCGNGYLSQKLINKSNVVIGIDIDSQFTKEKKINFIVNDLNKYSIPIKDESIDIVVSCHCLEHLYRPDKTLLEIHRILKNGGYAIISVPNYASPDFCLKLLSGKGFHDPYVYDDGTLEEWTFYYHHKYFTYYSLKRLLECTCFKIEKVITSIPHISPRYNKFNLLNRLLIKYMSHILFRVSPRFCQEPFFICTPLK